MEDSTINKKRKAETLRIDANETSNKTLPKRGLVELMIKKSLWILQKSICIGGIEYNLMTLVNDDIMNIKFYQAETLLYCVRMKVSGNEYGLSLCLGNVLSETHSDAVFSMFMQMVKNHLYNQGAFLINCGISRDDYSKKQMQKYSMNVFEFADLYEASLSPSWKQTRNYRKMKSLLKANLGKLTFTFDNFNEVLPCL